MIQINKDSFQQSAFADRYPADSLQAQLLGKISLSEETYEYDSADALSFELDLRREIVHAARDLADSGLSFSALAGSTCNPTYWLRTDEGGFSLKTGKKPSEAIRDIYLNGSQYATECATAAMITYYRALLEVYGDKFFDKQFSDIYLGEWDVREPLLKDLILADITTDILPGDRACFVNPECDPALPAYQGKNVIVLPDSLYYHHGLGVTTADAILDALNDKRQKDSALPAYFLPLSARPDFGRLYDARRTMTAQTGPLVWKSFPPPVSPV